MSSHRGRQACLKHRHMSSSTLYPAPIIHLCQLMHGFSTYSYMSHCSLHASQVLILRVLPPLYNTVDVQPPTNQSINQSSVNQVPICVTGQQQLQLVVSMWR